MPLRKFHEGPHCDRCRRWFPYGDDDGTQIKDKLFCRHCVPAMQEQYAEDERRKTANRKAGAAKRKKSVVQ
jgi:hypothetical protein